MKSTKTSVPSHRRATIGLLLLVWFSAVAALLFSRSVQSTQSLDSATVLDLSSLPPNSSTRAGTWRECKLLPSGTWAVCPGKAQEGGALRIAFAPGALTTTMPQAHVFCGGEYVDRVSCASLTEWTEERVDLTAYEGAECRVVFDCPTRTWIASCDLIGAPRLLPNVMIFLIDTLRPDHLSCYGYQRETSPNIDAFAAENIRFTHMIAQASWTRPSVASLLTSTYPSVHGAVDRADILPDDLTTLPELLRDADYETAAFMANPNCLPMFGFGSGFQQFVDLDSYSMSGSKDADVADAVIEALRNTQGRPWFFYVHNIGPHAPYDPPEPYRSRFVSPKALGKGAKADAARQIDLYDGAIAFTDAQFGRIVAALKELDMYENTLLAVVADHGEALGDHDGWGHGISLYDEQIRVPFIVKLPNSQALRGVSDGIAEMIDVAPTVLEYAEVPAPEGFQGRSLRDVLSGAPAPDRPAFSSLFLEHRDQYGARDLKSKYVFDQETQQASWFDLEADPGERRGLAQIPEQGKPLVQHAARIAASRRDGLHILVTGNIEESRTIAGTLTGEGLGEFRMRHAARNAEASMAGNRLMFRVNTEAGQGSPPDLLMSFALTGDVNNAHLVVQVNPESPLSANLTLDGKPIPAELVHLGADKRNAPLEGTVLRARDLEASVESFYPSSLPQALAVYIWYVPPAETLPDEALSPEMTDTLKSLGYLQ